MIAGRVYDSPLPYADVVTSTTHKTLRGPRGGMMLWNNPDYTKKFNSSIFPGTQGGPLMNIIAAKAQCYLEANTDEFRDYSAQVIKIQKMTPGVMDYFFQFSPWLLIIIFWFLIMRRMQGGGQGGIFSFAKSKAKIISADKPKVLFSDVAGCEEAKVELQEIVGFLKNPTKYLNIGAKVPRGALLLGPPGTGKTLLAKAVSGEAKVPFFTISGAEFVEMFVGVGASRVRDLFDQAKKNAPSIIFIDEIDAVGRHRGAGLGGGHDEREQTLNQILVEMDGFDTKSNVILLAATNRADVLDKALLRPGRFDRQIVVDVPDLNGREAILKIHTRNVRLSKDVKLKIIAKSTPGLAGADLENLVNEAALLAARNNKKTISMIDFENAKDKVMMGAERRSMVLTADQKEKTAFHEAGHAIVGLSLPQCDPVYKATIIPRGGALGMVVSLPEIDRLNWHKSECEEKLAMTMAGKAAEIIKYGEENVSNGPAGDIQQASGLARAMVLRWGMSDRVGDVDYSEAHEGYSGNTGGFSVSANTKELIEGEVKSFIQTAYDRAHSILVEKTDEWERLAEGLLEYETLTGDQIKRVMRGEDPESDDNEDDTKKSGGSPSLTAIPKTKSKSKTSDSGGLAPEPT